MDTVRIGCPQEVFSGIEVYPFDPRPEEIRIIDIGHSLAHQCRFNGHLRVFVSVAQHCCLVSEICSDPLWGLMHDAAEAYLCDVPRPIKQHPGFRFFHDAEKRIMDVVAEKFGLGEPPPDLKDADDTAMVWEYRQFSRRPPGPGHWTERYGHVPHREIVAWDAPYAERKFFDRFRELAGCEKACDFILEGDDGQ